jgi:hypothetical protein
MKIGDSKWVSFLPVCGFDHCAIGAVSLFFALIKGNESQGGRVYAIPEPPGLSRTVIKHMTKITVSLIRSNFYSHNPVSIIN